jgi:hypothetical protein
VSNNIISNVTLALASRVLLGYNALAATSSMHHTLLFGDPRIDVSEHGLRNGRL